MESFPVECNEFINLFEHDAMPEQLTIAKQIVESLTEMRAHNHIFTRQTDLFKALDTAVKGTVQQGYPRQRAAYLSFFHPGGANRELVEHLVATVRAV
jgi:hypothetical protein